MSFPWPETPSVAKERSHFGPRGLQDCDGFGEGAAGRVQLGEHALDLACMSLGLMLAGFAALARQRP